MMNNFAGCVTMTIEDVKRAQMALRRQEVLMRNSVKMPSITRKSDGRFCMNVPARYSTDKKRHQLVANTEQELVEKFNERVYISLTAGVIEEKTVNDIVEEWIDIRRDGMKPQTRATYNGIYRKHIKETAFGQSKIQEVRLPECQAFIDSLYHKNLRVRTVEHIKSAISLAFDYAIAQDYILRNYFKAVKINKNMCTSTRIHETGAWSPDELRHLWDFSVEQWNTKHKYYISAYMMFMASTGIRVGELVSAVWDDIDMENKTFSIARTRVSYRDVDTGKMVTGAGATTKTASSRRTIKLNPAAIFWLKEIKKRALYLGVKSEYIATNRRGEPMSQSDVDNRLKVFCNAAGLRYQSAHANRKTYATVLINEHVPTPEVSADLGHKRTTTTQDIYYKATATVEQSAGQKAAAILATFGNRLTTETDSANPRKQGIK